MGETPTLYDASWKGAEIQIELLRGCDHFGDDIRIAVKSNDGSGITYVAKPIELVELDRGSVTEPAIRLERPAMQKLFDVLWRTGYRPAGKEDLGTGEREAMQNHIKSLTNATDRIEQAQGEHIEDLRGEMLFCRAINL